jgi:hypothetical protein
LDAGDAIASATLWVSVRGMSADATASRICLDDLKNSKPLSEYAKSIPAEGSAVLRIDLAAELSRLSDGKLNLALGDQVAVDWSVLELRVAPAIPGTMRVTLAPEADADGLLRWDLSGLKGKILHAKVRLMPLTAGAADLENGACLASRPAWVKEEGIKQAPAALPFVTWWPQAERAVEFTVTPEVLGAMSRDGKLALELWAPQGRALAGYGTQTHADAAKRPQLILLTGGPAAEAD